MSQPSDQLRAQLDEIATRTMTRLRGTIAKDREASAAAAAATAEFDGAIAGQIKDAVDQLMAEQERSSASQWDGPEEIEVGAEVDEPESGQPAKAAARRADADDEELAERSWLE